MSAGTRATGTAESVWRGLAVKQIGFNIDADIDADSDGEGVLP